MEKTAPSAKGEGSMKGILFKPEMIKAILEGRKTVTRRIITPQPKQDLIKHINSKWWISGLTEDSYEKVHIPRYLPGEVVYIKEAIEIRDRLIFYPDRTTRKMPANVCEYAQAYHKMFMPAWAARYFIQIEDVRAERLQEITEEEAIKEGIHQYTFAKGALWKEPPDVRWAYIKLWDTINKPPHDWAANPWVWVYAFQKSESKE